MKNKKLEHPTMDNERDQQQQQWPTALDISSLGMFTNVLQS